MSHRRSSFQSTSMLMMALVLVGVSTLGIFTAPHAGGVSVAEICDNCYDDDGLNGTDRQDPMCVPPANGGFAGIGDESGAKGAMKCHKGIEKASFKFAAIKLGRLDKCVDLAFACVQRKNGDQACVDKAKAACDKQILAIPADETKLEAALEKACDDSQGASVSFNDVIALTGLGYSAEDPLCAGTFTTFSDVAACIATRHECGVERVLVAVAPRAGEMLKTLGHDPATEFPCLAAAAAANGADGVGAGLSGAAKTKATVKCQAALTKAGPKLGRLAFKAVQKCADAAATCIQVKPGSVCQAKASAKCQADFQKFSGPSGPIRKLLFATAKKCATPDLIAADLGAAAGLGFDAAIGRCSQFTLTPADPTSMTVECVAAQLSCEGAQMLEREVPRIREFADFLAVPIDTFGF